MEDFKYWWDYFTNNKLCIIILVAILVLVVVLIIIKKSSFGKKSIKRQDEKINESESKIGYAVSDIKKHKKETNDYVTELEKNFNKVNDLGDLRFAKLLVEYKNFKDDIFSVLDKIPNAKVKAEIEQIKEKYSSDEDIKQPFNTDFYELLNEEGDIKARLEKIEQILKEKDKVAETSDLTEEKGE